MEPIHAVAWPSASSPIIVSHASGTLSSIRGEAVEPVAAPGEGDVLELVISGAHEVWVHRCAAWGRDNPEEEGCLRHRYWALGGSGASPREAAPAVAAIGGEAAAPAGVQLSTATYDVEGRTLHRLDCSDASGTRALTGARDQIVSAPTWRWLSTTPPIALASIEHAGSDEGDPARDRRTRVVIRGCEALADAPDGEVVLGPHGLWAQATASGWEVYLHGRKLGAIAAAERLVFAGGEPSGRY